MTRRTRPNVPAQLHDNDREVLGFLQALLDYGQQIEDLDARLTLVVIPVGGEIKWRASAMPNTSFLRLNGQTVQKTDYPALWTHAQSATNYSTTATSVTVPNDTDFIVRAR